MSSEDVIKVLKKHNKKKLSSKEINIILRYSVSEVTFKKLRRDIFLGYVNDIFCENATKKLVGRLSKWVYYCK